MEEPRVRSQDINHQKWLNDKSSAIMVAASLVAAMAFATALTPPGGFWQETYSAEPEHAGISVLNDTNYIRFRLAMAFNTAGFLCSINTILLLLTDLPLKKRLVYKGVVCSMWIACFCMAVAYTIIVGSMVSPTYVANIPASIDLGTGKHHPLQRRNSKTAFELILYVVMALLFFGPWILYWEESIGNICSLFPKSAQVVTV